MVIGECSVDCLLLLMPGLDWQLATGNWQPVEGQQQTFKCVVILLAL